MEDRRYVVWRRDDGFVGWSAFRPRAADGFEVLGEFPYKWTPANQHTTGEANRQRAATAARAMLNEQALLSEHPLNVEKAEHGAYS